MTAEPPSSPAVQALAAELERHCRGEVLVAERIPPALCRDFGGMVERRPAIVLRPLDRTDIAVALQGAAARDIPITTRGAGHGQSGHALGVGLVLDMTRYAQVFVSDSGSSVEADAGATWQRIFAVCSPRGRIPLAPTHALDTTIGGTLSVGGVGAESFRLGAQADIVESMEVIDLDGRIVRCGSGVDLALFDAVRAGLGQCGVIARVSYPLRQRSPRVVTRCFAFADSIRFLAAARELADGASRVRWLTGAIRALSGVKGPLLYLFVGWEDEERAPARAEELGADFEFPTQAGELWNDARDAPHPFFRRFGGAADATLHPWVDHLFAETEAPAALESFLAEFAAVVRQGSANLVFVRRGVSSAPLLRAPRGELLLGISALSVFSHTERSDAEQVMLGYANRAEARGGYRYLSGFLGSMPTTAWQGHYGDAWSAFAAAKERYDPLHLLNPGLIAWK